ncbi:E3 ubiquitin-protein ligase Zswim2-like [Littorina saxatilis]|uniref:E3 ubiquitin-protein ligase ZSWIM2 n=1 Tax=Littorina saxatilis TaxID=31220 RepID=A0AAN9BT64_9CAEN
MPRNVAWRRTYSDFTCASQAFAANATMYILRQTGPTGFLLKEEGEAKNFKVFLGDPHSCTCSVFRKEKDLCKHICWVLLKKFKLDRDNPLSWQVGLSDMELDCVMRGPVVARRTQQRPQPSVPRQVEDASGGRPLVAQREIGNEDVCPICQDEFMAKKLPVTFCKFSCGNNVHIKCMKVWAEHQLSTSQDHTIKCPMCREDFGPLTLLKQEQRNADYKSNANQSTQSSQNRMDRHVGLGCSNCRMAPIEGKCYRCCSCADFYLCQACFNTPAHTHHSFQFRHKRNQRWRNAQRMLGAALPDAMVNDLMNREISASDYDTLLQLDNTASSTAPLSDLTEEAVQMLPVERARQGGALCAPGAQCRVCLRPYTAGQYVRKLPCQHKFHKDCIDAWLLHSRPICPIDSLPVFTTRPSSHTGNRLIGRQTDASSTSHGLNTSAVHSGRDEVRSLSVPSLGISSMRISAVENGEGRREGDRAALARRPPRDPRIPHRPPTRLELTGTRVGAEDTNSRWEETESDMLVPGGQLLQQAIKRRSQLSQHLTQLMLENNIQPVTAALEYSPQGDQDTVSLIPLSVDPGLAGLHASNPAGDSHFQFELGRRGSAGTMSVHDRARGGRLATSLRTKAPLRQRSGSHERTAPRSVQDLYLGNDPRVNPPPEGEVTAAQATGRGLHHGLLHRSSANSRKRIPIRGVARNPNIVLEGNSVLDHLTLRDIL